MTTTKEFIPVSRCRITAIALTCAITLTACGGANTSLATSASVVGSQVTAANVINGIVVPPDPGKANDDTVAGIDSDSNGIRDDIDRWIATQYGDKPGALEAIRMNVRATQKIITSNPVSQAEALAIAHESMDIGSCTSDKLSSEGVKPSPFWNEEFIRHYNTKERAAARKKVFGLAGMIVRSTSDPFTIACPYKASKL